MKNCSLWMLTKVITMAFDRLGRRVSYREMNGTTQLAHTVFLYNGYLCIQQLFSNSPWNVYKEFIWDPTEPVATRPLAFRQYGKTATFLMHDGNKNVTDVVTVAPNNTPVAHYDYAPFGAVTATGTRASDNPFRFSSEFADDSLGLVYYNYRHYNPSAGRWLGRDTMGEEGGRNLFALSGNTLNTDYLGLFDFLAPVKFVCNGTAYVGKVVANGAVVAVNGVYYTGKVVQTAVGTYFLMHASILDGEFFNEIVSDPSTRYLTFEGEKGCSFNISINGMANKDGTAFKNLVEEKIRQKVYQLDNPNNLTISIVGDDGLGLGDLIQSGLYEIGVQDLLSINFANAIYNAYQRGKANNCAKICISVYAHSQGTMVARRGFDFLKYLMMENEALASVSFCGYGGETRIDADEFGLRSATNIANSGDPIAFWGGFRDPNAMSISGPGDGHRAVLYFNKEK